MDEFVGWFSDCPRSSGNVLTRVNSCRPVSIFSPDTWPYLDSLEYPITLVLIYTSTAMVLGPYLMRSIDAIQASRILSVYNAFLSLAYFTIGSLLIYCMVRSKYSLWCQPFVRQKCVCGVLQDSVSVVHGPEDWIAFLIAMYHITKVAQLGEAVFMIMAKRRVSLVYSIHNASIAVLSWAGAMYAPGGTTAIMVTANCLSFSLVYLYGKVSQNSWPSYNLFASCVQIIQFTSIALLAITAYFLDCNYPTWGSIAVFIFIVKFSVMVMDELCWRNGVFSAAISLSETGFGAPWFHQ